jgi:hypothetical protein
MRLEYQLTFDDYREAIGRVKPVSHGNRRVRGWLVATIVIGALSVIVNVLTPRVPEARPFRSGVVLEYLPWLVVFLVLWFFVRRSLRGGLREQWEEQTALHRPKVVDFREDGLTVYDPAVRLDYHWTAVRQCGETPHLFVLYTADSAFQILPKRALGTDANVEQFRAYVNARLGGRHLFPPPTGGAG